MVEVSTIKDRLRINHNALDDQLEEDIEAAKAELVRVGISSDIVNSTDEEYPLINKAVIAYCLWIESSDSKEAERYEAMWNLWRDELRKSPEYRESDNV